MLDSLQLRCEFVDRGCTDIIMYSNIISHTNSCKYSPTKCTNEGCEVVVNRLDLQQHSMQCPSRIINCPFGCTEKMRYSGLEQHKKKCLKIPTPCINGCGKTVCREDMNEHTLNQCANVLIACPMDYCNTQLMRRELEKHIAENMSRHLLLTINSVKQLKQVIEEQKTIIKNQNEIIQNLQLNTCDNLNIIDFLWKIPEFNITATPGDKLTSPIFSAKHYNFVLLCYPGGAVAGNEISIFFGISAGKFDSVLAYPFDYIYTVTLLDQSGKGSHKRIQLSQATRDSLKVLIPHGNSVGWVNFISREEMIRGGYINAEKTVYIKLTVDFSKKIAPL